MPLITDLGSIGIIKDKPSYTLPQNAWSDGKNVRMSEGSVEKFLGHRQAIGTPSAPPYFVLPVKTATEAFWIYAGATNVYITDGATHKLITRSSGTYSAGTAANAWTGGVMGGKVFLNNGIDVPQQWATIDFATPTLLTDLTNWPSTSPVTTCKALGSFKQFMIAMNTKLGSTSYPRMVKWSHASSFNTIPSSWDETNSTLDAGEYELADTEGDILNGFQLRDSFLLYKEDSIWGMNYIGSPFIWRFFEVTRSFGALGRHAIAEFEGGHFVFGTNDCMIVDGQNIKSVTTERIRKHIYNSMDATYYSNSFVVPNHEKNEIWICYPTSGSTFPDQAVVWNWKTNTFGVRDLPVTPYIGFGVVKPGDALDWTGTGTWDDSEMVWDQRVYNPAKYRLVLADPANTKLHLLDTGGQYDDVNYTSYIERTGLHFGDPQMQKLCTSVSLNIEGSGAVNVYIGSHTSAEGSVSWSGPFSFTPGTDHKVDCLVTGRYLAIKVESLDKVVWEFHSYEMKITNLGVN
jgi:hypothetical protein